MSFKKSATKPLLLLLLSAVVLTSGCPFIDDALDPVATLTIQPEHTNIVTVRPPDFSVEFNAECSDQDAEGLILDCIVDYGDGSQTVSLMEDVEEAVRSIQGDLRHDYNQIGQTHVLTLLAVDMAGKEDETSVTVDVKYLVIFENLQVYRYLHKTQ